MVKIHESVTRFLNQDIFNSKDVVEDLTFRNKAESELFEIALVRFNSQLTKYLMSRAKQEGLEIHNMTVVCMYLDKLYLFTNKKEFLLLKIPENTSIVSQVDLLVTNAQKIKDQAWKYLQEAYQ